MMRVISLVVLASLCAAAEPSTRKAGERIDVPQGGISFLPPAGWKRLISDKSKTLARLTSPDSVPGHVTAMIMVDAGNAKGSLEQSAKAMAASWGGDVDPDDVKLGGEPARRVRGKAVGNGVRPLEGILAVHEGILYMLMGGAAPSEDCRAAVESMRASWKWIDYEPVSKHVEFGPEPLPICKGAFVMSVPETGHTSPTKTPDKVFDFAIYNTRRSKPDFLAYVQLAPKTQPFEALKDKFLPGIMQKVKFRVTPVWEEHKGGMRAVVTQACEAEVADQPERTATIKWALVDLDADHIVLINFTLVGECPQEQAELDALAVRMVESIRAAK